MLSRRLLVATAALLPFSADAGKRKKRRKTRRCLQRVLNVHPPDVHVLGCWRGTCEGDAPRCGHPAFACRCLGAGGGVSACVVDRGPSNLLCDSEAGCPGARVCMETCDHPGLLRCYDVCPS